MNVTQQQNSIRGMNITVGNYKVPTNEYYVIIDINEETLSNYKTICDIFKFSEYCDGFIVDEKKLLFSYLEYLEYDDEENILIFDYCNEIIEVNELEKVEYDGPSIIKGKYYNIEIEYDNKQIILKQTQNAM